MGWGSFIALMIVMVLALYFGIKASRERKKKIRDMVWEKRGELTGVIALVRQKKGLQAEGLLMNQGNNRAVARLSVVIIREMLKSGELE